MKISFGSSSPFSSSLSCASYQSPPASAFWKIVGFDVTPVTASSFISFASRPVSSDSRESESSQTVWPRPESLWRFDSDMLFRPFENRGRAGDHVVDGVAELGHDGRARRGGAEAAERERVALVADPALPALRDARLDGEPRPDVGRQDVVAVRLRLLLEDLPARHRDDADAGAVVGGELASG